MKIVTRSEWNARPEKFSRPTNMTEATTGHWNGPAVKIREELSWDHILCASLVRGVQNYHMDARGWSDIAYNFVVCPHGIVFEGRGINVRNAANGTNAANKSSHAVMWLSGDGNPFTREEKVGFSEAVAHIHKKSEAPDEAQGHRDHKATACPGDERYHWITEGMPLSAPTPPPPPPLPSSPPKKTDAFDPEKGEYGSYPHLKNKPMLKQTNVRSNYTRYAQGVLVNKANAKLKVDGYYGPKTAYMVKNFQRFFGLTVDGIVGPQTWGMIDLCAVL